VKIAILSNTAQRLATLSKAVETGNEVVAHENAPGQLASVLHANPDIVILDGTHCQAGLLSEIEQGAVGHPASHFIALCENATSDFLMTAMRVGIREVLPSSADAQTLLDAIKRIEQRLQPVAGQHQTTAKVIAFIACKGGSGATFLASNLAYVLAAHKNQRVALLDFNLQFGDAALFVSDQMPTHTLTDLANNMGRLDASLLSALMTHVLPNFGVLAAPEDPEHAVGIGPEHIEALLALAVGQFDYVVLDIGRILSAATVKALDRADMIFPVLQETLPFIRDSKRLIHTLQTLGYSKAKIHPIVNRYMKGGDILLEDVESALGIKVFKTVPNSYEAVSTSVNQGIPIYKIARHDKVTKALEEMAHELADVPQAEKSGWLSHLLHAG
jgi:pilus assembly protein CpaE